MSRLAERGLRREILLKQDTLTETLREWIVRELLPAVQEIRRILNAHSGNVVTVTGAHTVAATERIFLLDSTAGNFNVQLPPADGVMRELIFKKTDAAANTLTLLPDGAELIDGASSITVTNGNPTRRLISTDAGWITG